MEGRFNGNNMAALVATVLESRSVERVQRPE